MNTAIAYLRVSTDRQETDRQRRMIDAYCQLHDIELLTTIEEPEGISGRSAAVKRSAAEALDYYAALAVRNTGLIERPGYRQLLNGLACQAPNLVIFYALDRLARDATELLILERRIADHGAAIVAISQGGAVDTTTAAGWLQFAIQAVLAEHECRQISDRTKATLKAKQAAGKHVGRPKVGWRKGPTGWEHDPATWPTVEEVARLRRAGHTYRTIAAETAVSRSAIKAHLDAYTWNPTP